jgi:hypothetical protein
MGCGSACWRETGVPRLQIIEGVLGFMKNHLGHKVASTKPVEPITRRLVAAIEQFVRTTPFQCFVSTKGNVRTRWPLDSGRTSRKGRSGLCRREGPREMHRLSNRKASQSEDWHNLPALRGIGFRANRRLLQVEKITHDYILAEEPSSRTTVRVRSHRNAPRRCDAAIPKYKHSGVPCWCSAAYRRVSPTEISASISHPC